MNTPVFVISGLLESGKTTLIKNMFLSLEFKAGGPTLLILCEEGGRGIRKRVFDGGQYHESSGRGKRKIHSFAP